MDTFRKKICLMSIKPKYFEKIRQKTKLVEFRKVAPRDVDIIYLYVSSPVKQICGYIEVEKVIKNSVNQIWDEIADIAGLSKQELLDYVEPKEEVSVIFIKEYHSIIPISPSLKKNEKFIAPQNFIYLTHEKFSALV